MKEVDNFLEIGKYLFKVKYSDEAAGLCGYTTETPITEVFTTEEGTAKMPTTMKPGKMVCCVMKDLKL